MNTTALRPQAARNLAPLSGASARARRLPGPAAGARPSLRAHSLAGDVGTYLSEAASAIFHPHSDSVPWESSSLAFSGRITHHEEAARVRALQREVDAAVAEMESSMDEPALAGLQHSVDAAAAAAAAGGAAEGGSPAGEFVKTSIQRVFGSNFKGDQSEPRTWSTEGYAASGRHRSQRDLRHEYDRLQRFQRVVRSVAKKAEEAEKKA